MPEVIRIGGLELRFLRSKAETSGSLDMFKMTSAAQCQDAGSPLSRDLG